MFLLTNVPKTAFSKNLYQKTAADFLTSGVRTKHAIKSWKKFRFEQRIEASQNQNKKQSITKSLAQITLNDLEF